MLALIPARAGSKGLPGKALAQLGGLPLIAHAIACAQLCPEVEAIVVSTDSEEIAEAARHHGADVPFLRPAELALDETPMWPVVQHALDQLGSSDVLLLQPTNPFRLPEDVAHAVALLAERPGAEGVVAVSEPHSNPIWTARVERDGLLAPLVADGVAFARRQDVPRVVTINGLLYLWPADVVQARAEAPTAVAGLEVPARRAVDIDTAEDLEEAEALLASGLVRLPWLG